MVATLAVSTSIITVAAVPASANDSLKELTATRDSYRDESAPGSEFPFELALRYGMERLHCKDVGAAEWAYRRAPTEKHKSVPDRGCLLFEGNSIAHDSSIEASEQFKHVAAQDGPANQKISIKSVYATKICKLYQSGDFRRMLDFIGHRWNELYTLKDIYLSVRCKYHGNVDLLRASLEDIMAIRYSSIDLVHYFHQLAVKNDGDSLLTKVMYCEKRYRSGLHDFFDLLDYETERSRKRNDDWRVKHLLRLRKIMSEHARDFPFPTPRLQLGPAEARDHRRKWCQEHLAF